MGEDMLWSDLRFKESLRKPLHSTNLSTSFHAGLWNSVYFGLKATVWALEMFTASRSKFCCSIFWQY